VPGRYLEYSPALRTSGASMSSPGVNLLLVLPAPEVRTIQLGPVRGVRDAASPRASDDL
jgi:hypothetical protein